MEPLSKVLAADSQERGYRETSLWRREIQGLYFARKQYIPYPLPKFEQMTSQLPSPVFDENPLWVDLYWKTWELAFKNLHAPAPESGFVSQFFDTAFNDNIFLWDSCFMTLFGNLAHPLVPGISMLDNFYVKQHESGEICREIQRESGLDFILWANEADAPLFSRWSWSFPDKVEPTPVVYTDRAVPCPNPRLTLDALNHPVAAWAELESYGVTGDAERLRLVWEPLVRYYRALQKYLRQGNGLYITDWASMDNSPRNPRLDKGGTGVDISAEMVLFARSLSEIAGVIGQPDYADLFRAEADELAERINRLMWDEARKFYFDLTWDGKSCQCQNHRRLLLALVGESRFTRAGELSRGRVAESKDVRASSSGAYVRGRRAGLRSRRVLLARRHLDKYEHHGDSRIGKLRARCTGARHRAQTSAHRRQSVREHRRRL
ncbi:MAG: hypothetical protein KIS63_06095 [Caldilineales bacterium]|nr:hypothetical protein [Caldilineales bacterium]